MKNTKTIVLDHLRIQRIIDRFAHQIIEEYHQEKSIILIGIKGRGLILANRISETLQLNSKFKTTVVSLTLDKDEPRNQPIVLSESEAIMKNKVVILIDDVLNSGRTLVHSLCYLMRTDVKRITTIVLIDRIHRKFPVRADFVGLTLSTNLKEHVTVEFGKKKDVAYLE